MAHKRGMVIVVFVALLVCLVPKPENDLFFILRTGDDILRSHTLPHTDSYSWTRYGVRWDVPEWGAFVVYSLAHRFAGFAGTWLVMAALCVAAALVVYGWAAKHTNVPAACALTITTMLAAAPFVQERPYAFSYLLLPVGLIVYTQSRRGNSRWLLPLLCAVWANLHPAVLLFVGLLFLLGLREKPTLLTAIICAAAVCVSPYGAGIYRNAFVTLRDSSVQAHVTEWQPVYAVNFVQMLPFWMLAALAVAVLRRTKDVPATLALAALFIESVLHARQTALFAIGSVVLLTPHVYILTEPMRPIIHRVARYNKLLCAFGIIYATVAVCAVAISIRRALHTLPPTLEHVAQAVARLPRYPESACAFLDRQKFPPNLRLLNSFEDGGFLMWRRSQQRVFIDGRLDVYAGRTFTDTLVLETKQGTPAWVSLVREYNFDIIICTNPRTAQAFSALPPYKLAFWNGKRQWVFVRREGQAKA